MVKSLYKSKSKKMGNKEFLNEKLKLYANCLRILKTLKNNLCRQIGG